jgi:hypothetical protein
MSYGTCGGTIALEIVFRKKLAGPDGFANIERATFVSPFSTATALRIRPKG